MKVGNMGLINLLVAYWKTHCNYVQIPEKIQICKFLAVSYIAQGKEAYGKTLGLLEFQPYVISK